MNPKPRLFLLDANALLHRAWHALPPLTRPDGKVVNAVYGTLMSVMKLMQDEKPDAFLACWDTEVPTFRHEAFADYKGHREEQPDELYAQIPWIQEGLATLRVPSIFLDGFEADDVIGTLAIRAKNAGWSVVIVTSDRDSYQLIQPDISIMVFKKGVTETIMFDEAMLLSEYGLTPQQFLEYKVMRGDPSDNIPGIRGIGDKGATELLQTYGNLNGIYQAAHDPSSGMKAGVREKLLTAEKEVPAITKLVTIVTDAPVEWKPAHCEFDQIKVEEVRQFLTAFGFKTLLNRIPGNITASLPKTSAKESAASTKSRKEALPVVEETLTSYQIVELKDAQGAIDACKELVQAGEVLIYASRGSSDSLFASVVGGVVLSTSKKGYLFSKGLLRDKSVCACLQELLISSDIKKVGHDVKTELRYLESLGLTVDQWSFDIMLASYLLNAGERNYDVPSIAAHYVSQHVTEGSSPERVVEVLWMLLPVLRAALQKDGLTPVLDRFELPLVPVLFHMEKQGIKIDKAYLVQLAKDMRKEKEALEERMMVAAGKSFNPSSPSQLADILFEDLQLPTKGIKRGKTGYSTAASELEKLRGQHPLIEMVEEQRELSKLLSTYVDTLPLQADAQDRVHTTYNQAVAATGRLSSTDPNLQNIPIRTEVGRKIRQGFIAEKGYQLLSCDYSQIELRLMASLAKDKNMLLAFDKGEDIHTATASHIWHIPLDEVTKDQRRIAKAINFGLIFGQGPQGLSAVAGISHADAKTFIAAYFEAYGGIKNYMTETRALAHELGYVETLFGRKRRLPELQSKMHMVRAQAERMAINMPVQGTDADLMKLTMIKIFDLLPSISPKTRMLLQVHDELMFEVPEDEVETVAAFVKDTMEHVEKMGVPIVVEAKAGTNWAEMKKVTTS